MKKANTADEKKSDLQDERMTTMQRFIENFFYKPYKPCEARYTIMNHYPFTLIDHNKPCEEAKKHLETLTRGEGLRGDKISLTLYTRSRFFTNAIKSESRIRAHNLTPSEAKKVIEEFQERHFLKKPA